MLHKSSGTGEVLATVLPTPTKPVSGDLEGWRQTRRARPRPAVAVPPPVCETSNSSV